MSWREALASALRSLTAHKLRTVLTMLGMIFGVAAVVAMLAIGKGAEAEAQALIERLGLRNLLVRAKEVPEEKLQELRQRSPGVAPRDAVALAEALPGVLRVSTRVEVEPDKILAGAAKAEAKVYGVSPEYAEMFHLELAEGRFLDPRDERDYAQVCVIGPGVRRDLYGFTSAIGQDLKINDVWLEVVGVLAEGSAGSSSFQGVQVGSPESEIYLPAATALRKFDRRPLASPLAEIAIEIAPEVPAGEAAAAMKALLDQLHGGADDYELVVPQALLEQSRRTQELFRVVMGSIAGISLLVGGIGIMNIMLATVLERTREIGLRRAVGATQREVRDQFLVEAFAISAAGGLLGVAMGLAISRLVAATAGWATIVTPGSILLATGVSVAVGLLSGLYPAVRAARLDPIEALRYE